MIPNIDRWMEIDIKIHFRNDYTISRSALFVSSSNIIKYWDKNNSPADYYFQKFWNLHVMHEISSYLTIFRFVFHVFEIVQLFDHIPQIDLKTILIFCFVVQYRFGVYFWLKTPYIFLHYCAWGKFFMTSQRCPPFNSREAYITHYISTYYFPTFVVSWSFHDIQCKVTTYRMCMSLSDATVLILDLMHLIWYKCI